MTFLHGEFSYKFFICTDSIKRNCLKINVQIYLCVYVCEYKCFVYVDVCVCYVYIYVYMCIFAFIHLYKRAYKYIGI